MSTKLKCDNYGSSVYGSRDHGLSSKPVLKNSRPFLINSSKMQKGRFKVPNKKGFNALRTGDADLRF
jgi:hypothetical protein